MNSTINKIATFNFIPLIFLHENQNAQNGGGRQVEEEMSEDSGLREGMEGDLVLVMSSSLFFWYRWLDSAFSYALHNYTNTQCVISSTSWSREQMALTWL